MRVSLEITPRDLDTVEREVAVAREFLPLVNTINIPDIVRFDVRSWDACCVARSQFEQTIPHLRAMDFDPDVPLPIAQLLDDFGMHEVLVVNGDKPVKEERPVYDNNSVCMIQKLKREMPHIRVYAAIDPYRNGLMAERDYVLQKLDAGADGFFTQPFFDVRLMEIYADMLPDVEIFWGVTPILTEGSKGYWERVNQVIFPADMQLTMEWNRWYAQAAFDFARAQNDNIYFMPIRADLREWLDGIL